MVSEPMPAKTRFLATSFARALAVMRRMLADWILAFVRTCSVLQARLLTFLVRALPTAGSVGHTAQFHLAKLGGVGSDSNNWPYQH